MQALTSQVTALGYSLIDRGLIPDFVLRPIVRSLCRERVRAVQGTSLERQHEEKMGFIESLRGRDIAIEQDKANEQHYEVSTAFIQSCLGPQMKYSCCLYPTGKETLAEAETLMLESYCEKAKLQDGMDVLDLGCGWGSLCLFLAKKYPNSRIKALSNSTTQKIHIDSAAKERGLTNLEVFTGDVKEFEFDSSKRFDRVLSIEMFEHMKNYEFLLRKVSNWLKPNNEAKGNDGSMLFVHIFCHKTSPYDFLESDGWMSTYFFSGGTMPSLDLFTYFQNDLVLQRSWFINGRHYSLTCEDWLKKQDERANRQRWLNGAGMLEGKDKGDKRAEETVMYYRFRLFFISCSEFFGLNGGEEWGVGHYLFKKRD